MSSFCSGPGPFWGRHGVLSQGLLEWPGNLIPVPQIPTKEGPRGQSPHEQGLPACPPPSLRLNCQQYAPSNPTLVLGPLRSPSHAAMGGGGGGRTRLGSEAGPAACCGPAPAESPPWARLMMQPHGAAPAPGASRKPPASRPNSKGCGRSADAQGWDLTYE